MEAAPTPGAQPATVVERPIHPAARWLAKLLSPMSLRDQDFTTDMFQRILWSSLAISFPIAYWMGNILVTVGGLFAAMLLCFVLFVPNWWQHPDPDLKYASDIEVYEYYQQYEAAKKAAREKASKKAAPEGAFKGAADPH